MPIQHIFTSPLADGTNTQLVRPSDWNNTHAYTLQDGIVIGGNTSGAMATISSGTVTIAGGNNITLSQVGNGVTISGPSLSPYLQASETTKFAGTGLSLTNATATLNSAGLQLSVGAGGAGDGYNIIGITGNTAGTLGTSSATSIYFAGGNNVTLSQSGNTITISGANVGGAQTGISGIAGSGASTVTQGTVQFANSNGITFGLNGSTMTASHNGLTTAAASGHSHGNPTLALTNLAGTTASASNGLTLSLSATAQSVQPAINQIQAGGNTSGTNYTLTTGSMQFYGGNNITLSQNSSNSNILVLSVGNYITTARASTDAVGLNTAGTAVTWTVNSSGISLNAGAYLTTAAAVGHSHGNPTLALTNIAGTTNSASNGLTLSLSATAQSVQPAINQVQVAGNTSGTNYSLTTGSLQLYGGNNITLSQNSSNSNILVIVGPSPSGGAGPNVGFTNTGNSAGNNFLTSGGSVYFQGSGIVTASGSTNAGGAQTIWMNAAAAASDHSHGNPTLNLTNLTGTTASNSGGFTLSLSAAAPGGGAAVTISKMDLPYPGYISNVVLRQGTFSFYRFSVAHAIDATRAEYLLHISGADSQGLTMSHYLGIFTLGNRTSASLASSTSGQFSYNSTLGASASYTAHSGTRWRSMTMAAWNITPGEYILGAAFSTATGQTAPTGVTIYGSSAPQWIAQASQDGNLTHALLQGIAGATSMKQNLSIGNVTQTGNSVNGQPFFRLLA